VTRSAVIAALGAVVLAAFGAPAQEPDRLERLSGVCRDADGAAIGAYAGRVLWTEDGRISGMMTRDEDAEEAGALAGETVSEGVAPRSITVPRQAPEEAEDGLVVRTTVMFLSGVGAEIGEALIACTVKAAEPTRPDPGATSRG
jgi:hypothetical protein